MKSRGSFELESYMGQWRWWTVIVVNHERVTTTMRGQSDKRTEAVESIGKAFAALHMADEIEVG